MKTVLIGLAVWYLAMLLLALWSKSTNKPVIKKLTFGTSMVLFFVPLLAFIWVPLLDGLIHARPVTVFIFTVSVMFIAYEIFDFKAKHR